MVLITLKMEYSSNLTEQIEALPDIKDVDLIYGPYDAYAIVETETKRRTKRFSHENTGSF